MPDEPALLVTEREDAVRFTVRVQPRASRSELAGTHGAALKVRLTAAPVDNAANDALVELLARALGVAKRDVRVIAGHASRSKTIEVSGATAGDIERLVTG